MKVILLLIALFISNCYSFVSKEIDSKVEVPKIKKQKIISFDVTAESPETEALFNDYVKDILEKSENFELVGLDVRSNHHLEITTSIISVPVEQGRFVATVIPSFLTLGLVPTYFPQVRRISIKFFAQNQMKYTKDYELKLVRLFGIFLVFLWEDGILDYDLVSKDRDTRLIKKALADIGRIY